MDLGLFYRLPQAYCTLPLFKLGTTVYPVISTRAMETRSPVNYREIITVEPGKRSGKPCIRGLRITVYDVLGWLAAGMTEAEILDDFPELTVRDIRAALAFAADPNSRARSQEMRSN
jgi:uncharacterized protein (DUF433 family)